MHTFFSFPQDLVSLKLPLLVCQSGIASQRRWRTRPKRATPRSWDQGFGPALERVLVHISIYIYNYIYIHIYIYVYMSTVFPSSLGSVHWILVGFVPCCRVQKYSYYTYNSNRNGRLRRPAGCPFSGNTTLVLVFGARLDFRSLIIQFYNWSAVSCVPVSKQTLEHENPTYPFWGVGYRFPGKKQV